MRWFLSAALWALSWHPVLALTVIDPPARYSGAYKGDLVIHHASMREIMYRRCFVRTVGPGFSCTYMEELPGRCTIWMPRVGARAGMTLITQGIYRQMLRHELAHCNGWPPNHPP
jgi:hypothetical protein